MSRRFDVPAGVVIDRVIADLGGELLVAARPARAVDPDRPAEYLELRVRIEADEAEDAPSSARTAHQVSTVAPCANPSAARPRTPVALVAVALAVLVAVSATHLRPSAAGGPPLASWDASTATLTLQRRDGTARRFLVGAPGDQLVVGDWDHDGRPTAILYRPATGERWRFARWPDVDTGTGVETLVARPIAAARAHGTLRAARVLGRDVAFVE